MDRERLGPSQREALDDPLELGHEAAAARWRELERALRDAERVKKFACGTPAQPVE